MSWQLWSQIPIEALALPNNDFVQILDNLRDEQNCASETTQMEE